VKTISWTDNDPATDDGSTARTITRTFDPNSPSQATLTFPSPAGSPVSVRFN
jgi:hypothetical protein